MADEVTTEPKQPKQWVSNETKVGLGLAACALGTVGLFALAVKFSKSRKPAPPMNASAFAGGLQSYDIEGPGHEGGGGDGGVLVPMKTLNVTFSMQVPQEFSKRDIDGLLSRMKVLPDPSCRYLGIAAVGEPWGAASVLRG